jgi:cell division septation protein DedD
MWRPAVVTIASRRSRNRGDAIAGFSKIEGRRMRGVFDDKEIEPAKPKRDTELTLGSGTLLAIFFGLVLLCGLCFGLGYALGHRGTPPAAATPATSATPALDANGSIAKPSATEQAAQTVPASTAGSDQPSSADSSLTQAAEAETLPAQAVPAAAQGQPQIRPALTPAVETNQPGQPAVGLNVHPAIAPAPAAPAGSLMVQIAAVSNTEDAQVLTNALRKRGYAVTARREPADNLIHVRIGPFSTLAEANTWKLKLLNDGYNAIVQP